MNVDDAAPPGGDRSHEEPRSRGNRSELPTSHLDTARAFRRGPHRLAVGLLVPAGAVLVWTRLVGAQQSFYVDELTTVVNYASGPRDALLGPFDLNNHVLFSVAAWAAAEIGGRSEAMYRLPSIVAALAAVLLLARWAWARLGPVAAAVVTILFAVSPTHLVYGPQARGYGFALLAAAMLLVSADEVETAGGRAPVVRFCVAAAAGVLTLGTVVLPVLSHAALLLRGKPLRRPLVAGLLLAGAASALVYLPMLLRGGGEEAATIGVGFKEDTLPWYGVVTGPIDAHLRDALATFAPGRPTIGGSSLRARPVLFAAAAGLAALGFLRLRRTGDLRLALHLALPVAVTFGTFVVLGALSSPRFTSFLLPHLLVALAMGVVELLRLAQLRRATGAIAVVVLVVATAVALTRTMRSGDRLAATPRQNFRAMSEIVEGSGIENVLANADAGGLAYYLPASDIRTLPATELEARFCTGDAPLAYVELDTRDAVAADTSCLRERGAVRVDVPQRARRWSVWLLGAASASVRGPAAGNGG